MGKCIYCGQAAGWFSHQHKECESAHLAEQLKLEIRRQKGREEINLHAHATLSGTEAMADLPAVVANLQTSHDLTDSETRNLLIAQWRRAVDAFLDDGLLVDEEERRLVEFARCTQLAISDLPEYDRLVKSAAITDLVNGRLPNRFRIPDGLPINLQRGETIVWSCANTAYLEDKTRRQYVGRSQGVSLRIMSGVYYRVGAFKGHAVEHTQRVHIDDGWLIITDQNIYFSGPRKSLRIPYSKVVSFEPFSDGIGLHRDAATAKPQVFVTGDGWFTYNLVANLAKR